MHLQQLHLFQYTRAKSEDSQFRRWQKSPKINCLPWQRPLDYGETYGSFLIPIHVTTYAERLTKIGVVISVVTGPNVTKIVHNVDKSTLFTILKSEL